MVAGPGPGLLSDVIARHAPRLMALPGVVGIGAGQVESRPCLILLVSSLEGALPDLPAMLEGYPLVVERTGRLQSQMGDDC